MGVDSETRERWDAEDANDLVGIHERLAGKAWSLSLRINELNEELEQAERELRRLQADADVLRPIVGVIARDAAR